MSVVLQIGQIAFFFLLFAAAFIFISRETDWLGPLNKVIESIENDFRHIIGKRIFERLDHLNNRYEKVWNSNKHLIPLADESERVDSVLYEELYDRLAHSVEKWKELGREVVEIFQEMDTFIHESSIPHLLAEAVKVAVRRSRLDGAALRIDRLQKVIGSSTETYEQIKRIPARVDENMEALKKDIRDCLLENIEVVESVKGERIEGHLRKLSKILKEREPMAERLEEIVQNKADSRADKEMLSTIHVWLLLASEEISNARAEFRIANQTFSELTLMEKQVRAWYTTYGDSKEAGLFEGMIIDDLEKRVVALKELWEVYENDFIERNQFKIEDRTQRIHFILDEVERFDQDINFVNASRSSVEKRLNPLQQMDDINHWVMKTSNMCPFTVQFDRSTLAANQYEKALIGWDNPRPYDNVQAFVEHAKRMEQDIEEYSSAISALKENYRFVKNIEGFHSVLKNGLLKKCTSAVLEFYQYANQEPQIDMIEWEPFEQLLAHVELLLQDNPIASAQRHDPISEEQIPDIHSRVEKFKLEWEQALGAIQENYALIQRILQKDIELMGTQWLEFVYSIQGSGGGGFIFPYHVIPIPEPNGKLTSVISLSGFQTTISTLNDADLIACHQEVRMLSRSIMRASEKAERILIKHRGIKNTIDQCSEIVRDIKMHDSRFDESVIKRIKEHALLIDRFDDISNLGDTYDALWETLGLLENLIRVDLMEFEKIYANMERAPQTKTDTKTDVHLDSA